MTENGKITMWIILGCTGGLLILGGAAFLYIQTVSRGPGGVGGAGTQNQMASLSMAIHVYRDTFHTFPPSDPSLVAACGNGRVGSSHASTGAESLNFFLRGWYMNGANVVRGQGYKIAYLDGRTKTILPMYPFNENEEVDGNDSRYGFGGAGDGKFFCDNFSHRRPILYFKAAADGGSQPFTESHNALPLAKWKAPNARSFASFIKPDGVTPRSREFILWSAGPDGLFLSSDDIIVCP